MIIISVMVGMMPGSEHVAHHLEEARAFQPRRLDLLLRHLAQRREEDDAQKSPPVPEIDGGDADTAHVDGRDSGLATPIPQPVEQAEDAGHRLIDHALPDARGDRRGDDHRQEIDRPGRRCCRAARPAAWRRRAAPYAIGTVRKISGPDDVVGERRPEHAVGVERSEIAEPGEGRRGDPVPAEESQRDGRAAPGSG